MSRFSVTWDNEALAALAIIWLDASDREEIVLAVNQIDRSLADDPIDASADLHEGLRALVAGPLRVLIEIDTDRRAVDVIRIMLN